MKTLSKEEMLLNEIAQKDAEIYKWKSRYENANRMCNSRAEERAKIVEQLFSRGLIISNGNITELPKKN